MPGARSSAATARPRAVVATLLAALGLLVGFVALVGQLTRGFEYWTFEALRRDDAAGARLLARPVELSGPYGAASTPWPGQPGEVCDLVTGDGRHLR